MKLLQQAYQLLIAPIEGLLAADPQARVVFVPQDTLYLLPFAALQDSAGKYLIEKHTIATEVSAEVLELSRKKFQLVPAKATAALVVGNPVMPRGYPPLPGAEKEAVAVAGLFSAMALTGAQATKAAVVQRAGDSRILHFATHGVLNGAEEQFSGLVLAPDRTSSGFLAAREIRALKLNAEMVVLSACDTGEGKLTGDGVLGLGRAFVEAGVPSLVVSLWSIPDAPTAALMVEFYQNIRIGQGKAQALRTAMLATMKQFPEPRSWAAFTLLGVPEASAVLRSVRGTPPSVPASSYAPVFPVPDGAQNYRQSDDRNFNFETSMSLTEAIAFYRQAFRAEGYREDSARASIDKQSFLLVFHGPWKDQELFVNGADSGGSRTISVALSAVR
jgi:CHAT domain-containing protein